MAGPALPALSILLGLLVFSQKYAVFTYSTRLHTAVFGNFRDIQLFFCKIRKNFINPHA